MKFHTQIPLQQRSDHLMDYRSKVLLLGSCFAENIGDLFEYYKFQNCQNPFGIVFNPRSIEKLVLKSIQKERFTEADVFFHNEQWHCHDVHSKLSRTSKTSLLQQLNGSMEAMAQQLKKASHIIITLGTAWVYTLKSTGRTVANCHKVPQSQFTKTLLPIDRIVRSLCTIVENGQQNNPEAHIIFTVSPVRHLKDGFVENNLGKAHLIAAVHACLSAQSSKPGQDGAPGCSYFPSFEIMMDELRDYRFYAEDMLHPNQMATDYIWEAFKHVWMSPGSYKTMDAVAAIQKGLRHRAFDPKSQSYQAFLKDLEAKKQQLTSQFPHIVF